MVFPTRKTYFGVPALRAEPHHRFFFYVPKSKIIEVEMSTEDAATLIMSCGVVQPGSDPQKKLAALAEWRMPRGSRMRPRCIGHRRR